MTCKTLKTLKREAQREGEEKTKMRKERWKIGDKEENEGFKRG